MKAIVTGLNGTVAPVLRRVLQENGVSVVGWDRQQVSPDDETAVTHYLEQVRPDWVCHLALGAERWAQQLAHWCQQRGVGFLFTSTAMVFDQQPDGPHRVGDPRTARDEYGRYKIRCEDAICAVSAEAIIARIGWQIGWTRGGNQMFEALHMMHDKDGVIQASTSWTPATSFLEDTAEALWQLISHEQAGTYHLDSNAVCALSFFEIVQRLKAWHAAEWVVQPNEVYRHDQRLLDDHLTLSSLVDKLPV